MGQPAKVIPITPVPGNDAPVTQALYEVHKKVYPRAVTGWFAAWRWALVWATQLVFYGLAWLPWNGRQAVLFDIAQRKFYLFGLVLWPQDVVYLTVILILSALSLFLFTTVAGRLWCGYACPQTVYTEIFLWIERRIEGDRNKRMALDQGPLTARKFGIKFAKHFAWVAVALWTGYTFVGYFTPIRELGLSMLSFVGAYAGSVQPIGPWEGFWVLFYGFATYGNAGWMREQVCKYMCPYARFQSAMFDKDTMIITYDPARGEPRGGRSKSADPKALGLGDCIDCGICVQVCPTGIDIRKGLQYECIGCAACIDGCNQVMDKMGYARGLIRYSTTHAIDKGLTRAQMFARVLRPRVLVYFALLGLIAFAGAASLWSRVPLKVDLIRDRAAISREADDGRIENVYRMQIMNTTEEPREYQIRVGGLKGAQIASAERITVPAASSRMVPIRVRADREAGKGTHSIHFDVSAVGDEKIAVHERSVFVIREDEGDHHERRQH